MKVELGSQGLDNSYQDAFPENTACIHGCGGVAIPAVCLMEVPPKDDSSEEQNFKKGDYIRNLTIVSTKDDKEKMLWPHDLTAFVIYLCPVCLEPTTLFNQG